MAQRTALVTGGNRGIGLATAAALVKHGLRVVLSARQRADAEKAARGVGAQAEGLDGPASYSVTKAALNALTVSLSHSLRGDVKVNSCCPGWVRTRMGGVAAELSPEEGADTIVWLATLPRTGPNGGFFRGRAPIAW